MKHFVVAYIDEVVYLDCVDWLLYDFFWSTTASCYLLLPKFCKDNVGPLLQP